MAMYMRYKYIFLLFFFVCGKTYLMELQGQNTSAVFYVQPFYCSYSDEHIELEDVQETYQFWIDSLRAKSISCPDMEIYEKNAKIREVVLNLNDYYIDNYGNSSNTKTIQAPEEANIIVLGFIDNSKTKGSGTVEFALEVHSYIEGKTELLDLDKKSMVGSENFTNQKLRDKELLAPMCKKIFSDENLKKWIKEIKQAKSKSDTTTLCFPSAPPLRPTKSNYKIESIVGGTGLLLSLGGGGWLHSAYKQKQENINTYLQNNHVFYTSMGTTRTAYIQKAERQRKGAISIMAIGSALSIGIPILVGHKKKQNYTKKYGFFYPTYHFDSIDPTYSNAQVNWVYRF